MKVVICGAGFIGNYVARAFAASNPGIQIVLASRQPKRHVDGLQDAHAHISSASADVTNASTLRPVFQDAHTVVSLVGILQGSPAKFEAVQWKGAQNVAQCAQEVGAKLVHLSAIGANPDSELVSPRTKGLGEKAVLEAAPTATVIRPSLVFGPGDSFFTRFATLARFFPVMPVMGSGMSKFQPVYVGDLARLIELCSRSKDDASIAKKVDGKILEAGGPEVFTFREILQLVFKYSGRWRPMVPVPLWAGYMQGAILEKLPESILTISRDQVAQLQLDNVVADAQKDVVPELLKSQTGESMKSVHDILPTYLSS